MTPLITLSPRNTWNFFQNFSSEPFSRNDVYSVEFYEETCNMCIWIHASKSRKLWPFWCSNYIFRIMNVLFGKVYLCEKILEIIPYVPLTKTYRSSHSTSNFVPYWVPKSRELIKKNQYDSTHHTQCLYIGWDKRSLSKLLQKTKFQHASTRAPKSTTVYGQRSITCQVVREKTHRNRFFQTDRIILHASSESYHIISCWIGRLDTEF